MKTRSIPFSTTMVFSILADRKGQTRRGLGDGLAAPWATVFRPAPVRTPSGSYGREGQWIQSSADDVHMHAMGSCPYGVAGDRLWVREEHYRFGHWERIPGALTKTGRQKWRFVAVSKEVRYSDNPPATFRKGMPADLPWQICWYKRNARFMPRACSRILLEVVSVRVERLQEISAADALAEGIFYSDFLGGYCVDSEGRCFHGSDPVAAYANLWEMVNGPGTWAANPLVWVVEFRRVRE